MALCIFYKQQQNAFCRYTKHANQKCQLISSQKRVVQELEDEKACALQLVGQKKVQERLNAKYNMAIQDNLQWKDFVGKHELH